MLVATASPARTALKISQLTDGGMPPTYDSMHEFWLPPWSLWQQWAKQGIGDARC
jgi:hypothetical protein